VGGHALCYMGNIFVTFGGGREAEKQGGVAEPSHLGVSRGVEKQRLFRSKRGGTRKCKKSEG